MITYAPAVKTAMMQAVADKIDAAEDPGYLEIYGADQPAAGAAITDQTLLATIEFADPCGAVTNGMLNLTAPIEDDNLPASGTTIWGRIYDGDGNWVADGDIDLDESGAMIEVNQVIVYQGGIFRITAAALGLT